MKLSVAGPRQLLDFQKTANVFAALEHLYPQKFQADICEFDNEEMFLKWANTELLLLFKGTVAKISDSVVSWVDDSRFIGSGQAGLNYARELLVTSSSSQASPAPSIQSLPDMETGGTYDYDVLVIGGGSGGLAFSKRASKHGAKVCLLDFVKPSPQGSKWGLGGTCVNVGCIPKKLFHTAALIAERMQHAANSYGFGTEGFKDWPKHEWPRLVQNVQDYIKSLNFGYVVQMRTEKVTYLNKLAKFVDPHTVEAVDKKGEKSLIRARRFLIAVGGRPRPLGCPGEELSVSSDDIFFQREPPGKTLVVGASYVALECAGFLRGLGFEVKVMVRSILLRGFDQDMSERVGKYMEREGLVFIRGFQPKKLERVAESNKIRVYWGDSEFEDFDTVLTAIGRDADTKFLGLDAAGVKYDLTTGKIPCQNEQTNVPHIYALGDVLLGRPELTPVAIEAGKLLANRLFANKAELMEYEKICTTVFTPLEYSCVGLTEEQAMEKLGDDSLEVYHTNFIPLEWSVSHGEPNDCYLKVLVNLSDHNRVVGLHYLGPNAGEVILGYGVAFKMGMTFHDLVSTIGIHPTTSEEFTLVNITKRSGLSPEKTGC